MNRRSPAQIREAHFLHCVSPKSISEWLCISQGSLLSLKSCHLIGWPAASLSLLHGHFTIVSFPAELQANGNRKGKCEEVQDSWLLLQICEWPQLLYECTEAKQEICPCIYNKKFISCHEGHCCWKEIWNHIYPNVTLASTSKFNVVLMVMPAQTQRTTPYPFSGSTSTLSSLSLFLHMSSKNLHLIVKMKFETHVQSGWSWSHVNTYRYRLRQHPSLTLDQWWCKSSQ